MNSCFLIFGFGYTAKALAPKLVAAGFKVIATSRSPEDHQHDNSDIQVIDFNSSKVEHYLSLATHLLFCIPPTSGLGDIVLNNHAEAIKKQAPHLKWLGYLSSTGVYGDHEGNWVNEDSVCIPHTATGMARLQAEQAWTPFAEKHQLPLHIFRLSGIYGPERNALERLLQGKKQSVFKENQVFCRIHVEDIVSTLLASIQSPKPLSIYNVADDEPAAAHVVDQFAATLLHRDPLPLIPFTEAHLSAMEQEFYANNRRVSNAKMKQELHVVLQYPTYKEGLSQLWRTNYAPK